MPLSSRVVTNKSILYKNTLFYCSPCYFSASHGYVHLCNSYPDPLLNWISFINLSVAYVYCTSVYDSASHCHVNKLIRYKNALSYCTTCYFSASHGYVHLYNSYPGPLLNWTNFFNLSDTSAYCSPAYVSEAHSLVNTVSQSGIKMPFRTVHPVIFQPLTVPYTYFTRTRSRR